MQPTANRIVIDRPSIAYSTIRYRYEVTGPWAEAFNLSQTFEVKYDIDISNVPESIAVVPLLANVLPVAWVYDAEGIDLAAVKEIKEVNRGRLSEYKKYRPNAEYHEGRGVWSVKVDIALPCATQNELHLEDAKALVANGCFAVAEGANMPTTLEATDYLQENGVLFAPGKAANSGGVATSALEMSQNSERLSWTFEEVDSKLKGIMVNICHNMADAAKRYGHEGNYVIGANIAGFEKVVNAMEAQGIV